MENNQTRRDFFKIASTISGGLLLGFNWHEAKASTPNLSNNIANAGAEFNSYLAIEPSGKIIIFSPNPEIGQGIKTAFPVIVAEELEVDWANVEVRQANLDITKFERQLTGGSGAIKHSWERLRKAGATAKHLLTQAAANQWNVPFGECKAENGYILHTSGKKMGYGELASAAALLKAPEKVELKNIKNFKLIGQTFAGVDNNDLLVGKPLFGIDYKTEGMLHAQIQRPAFGAKLKSFDASETKKMPGIVDVVAFGDKVAIVGKSTWEIMQARKTLKIDYTNDKALETTNSHNKTFSELMDRKEAEMRRKDGDIEAAFKSAAKIVEAEYQCPFVPHNTMEPMNFFADVKNGTATLVGPTQTPQNAQTGVAKLLNITADKVTVQLTKMGGGFGRRLNNDYALEAAELSSIIKAPVKVTWTREDDMTGGIYRPAVRYKFKASLDATGNMTGFYLKGVGMNAGNSTRHDNFPAGAVENLLIETIDYKSTVTTGPWRAPITNFLAYAEQAFLDEVAQAAGKDPIKFRLELFEKSKTKPVGKITYEPDRFITAIKTVAEKAGWGKKKKKIAQGFAVYFSHLSYVAQIAEMEKVKGVPTIKKVYAVTDCGIVINQSGAKNQIYGAIVDGIGTSMYGNLIFENGLPSQTNYDKYRLIRYNEIPEVEAHFIDNGIDPTGLGEPALPPTGGAVANAYAKLTGKRFYKQPFALEDKKITAIS
jgi:isoquinoline 1-oxidoreductase subunit beta